MIVVSLLLLAASAWVVRQEWRRQQCPPGLHGWLIIGNILQVGSKLHKSLAHLSKTYGPLISLQLGTQFAIVASSPQTAMEVLQKHGLDFANGFTPNSARVLGRENISLAMSPLTSPVWRKLRHLAREELFSKKALQASRALRETFYLSWPTTFPCAAAQLNKKLDEYGEFPLSFHEQPVPQQPYGHPPLVEVGFHPPHSQPPEPPDWQRPYRPHTAHQPDKYLPPPPYQPEPPSDLPATFVDCHTTALLQHQSPNFCAQPQPAPGPRYASTADMLGSTRPAAGARSHTDALHDCRLSRPSARTAAPAAHLLAAKPSAPGARARPATAATLALLLASTEPPPFSSTAAPALATISLPCGPDIRYGSIESLADDIDDHKSVQFHKIIYDDILTDQLLNQDPIGDEEKDVIHSSVDVSGSIYGSNDDIYDYVQGVHYLQSVTDEGGRLLVLDRSCKCLSREKTESLANAGVEEGAIMPELDVSRLSFPQYEPFDVWDKVTQLIEVVAMGNALDLIVLRSWLSVFYYFTGGYMFSVYHKQGERGPRYRRPSLATFCGFSKRGRSTLLFGAKRRSCVFDPGGCVFLQVFLLVHGVLMVQGIIVKRKETSRLKLISSHGKDMLEKEDDDVEYVDDYPEIPPLLYLGAVDMKLQLDISNESIPMVVANACQLNSVANRKFKEHVKAITRYMGVPNISDFIPIFYPFYPLGLRKKIEYHIEGVLESVQTLIEQRLQARGASSNYHRKNDFLETLIDLYEGNEYDLSIQEIKHTRVLVVLNKF
ncbi:hypothetical protein SASPL_135456 [Salvia splendens]|uniref:Uncharacterized protein n=1 Tax=Salvia splendens TaxID=180675 RepID=A0A8X8WZN8_SALSN|nr:hypothetical protein SASPL_135456 [Salvia splendens]